MIRAALIAVLVGVLAWFGWAASNTTAAGGGQVVTTVGPDDIPGRTFEAYQAAVAQSDPACGLRWETLAGFGAIESSHGTYQGDGETRGIGADGVVSPPIIGPALDGGGFALIWDTDGGKLDGDATYDRAVGPTQFLPTTWAGVMGEGHNPQDVDDAAVATARKVCADASGPITESANLTRAAYSYNPSSAYVTAVVERVDHYMLWSATNPSVARATAVTVDEPTLRDVMSTMGASGRRAWSTMGERLAQDGTTGTLDEAYRKLNPGVDAVLGGLEGQRQGTPQAAPVKVSADGAKIAAAAKAWAGRQFAPGIREQCANFVRSVLTEVGVDPGVTRQPIDGWGMGPEAIARGESINDIGPAMADSFGPDQGLLVTDPARLAPGDIVVFANTYGEWRKGVGTHVGIYVGDGQIVDRPTAAGTVKLRPLSTFDDLIGGIRLGASDAR